MRVVEKMMTEIVKVMELLGQWERKKLGRQRRRGIQVRGRLKGLFIICIVKIGREYLGKSRNLQKGIGRVQIANQKAIEAPFDIFVHTLYNPILFDVLNIQHIKIKAHQTKDICLFFLSGCPSSTIPPSTNPCRYYRTLVNLDLITESTSCINLLVPSSDHSPSLNDI